MNLACATLRHLLLLIALPLLLLTPSSGQAQDADKEDAPAYNDLVARTFLIEVEPLVEKHTGWDCEWPVAFQLVNRTSMSRSRSLTRQRNLQSLAPELI